MLYQKTIRINLFAYLIQQNLRTLDRRNAIKLILDNFIIQ